MIEVRNKDIEKMGKELEDKKRLAQEQEDAKTAATEDKPLDTSMGQTVAGDDKS